MSTSMLSLATTTNPTSARYMITNEEAYRNRAFIQTQAIYHLENYESGLSSCNAIYPFLTALDEWEDQKRTNSKENVESEKQLINEMERLMLINIRPTSESELHLVLEGYEERFTEEDADELILLVTKYLINEEFPN